MSDKLIEIKRTVAKSKGCIADLEIKAASLELKAVELEAKIEVNITALHIFRERIKGLAKKIGEINSLQMKNNVL